MNMSIPNPYKFLGLSYRWSKKGKNIYFNKVTKRPVGFSEPEISIFRRFLWKPPGDAGTNEFPEAQVGNGNAAELNGATSELNYLE